MKFLQAKSEIKDFENEGDFLASSPLFFLLFFSIKLWKCETWNKSQHVLRCEIKKVHTFLLRSLTNGKSTCHLIRIIFIYKFAAAEEKVLVVGNQRESFVVGSIIFLSALQANERESERRTRNSETIYHHCIIFLSAPSDFHTQLGLYSGSSSEVKFQKYK